MNLAFKDADRAAASSKSWMGAFFSRAIKWKTGGRFSHVELWMAGPKESATCFSSREPEGTGYATIDLSEMVIVTEGGHWGNPTISQAKPLWTCVEIPATPEEMYGVQMFVEGVGLKRYDFLGILGFMIPRGSRIAGITHDPAWLFCSLLMKDRI